jgi:D-alanyl-D-alanine carboxypeptidase (penicillin-binding protein 5/6)
MLPAFRINNHNRLLYNYDGAIGIKNGYTIAAQQTFIAAATRGGKTYIVTELSSPNGSWRPTAALLDWAFAHADALTPIGQLVEPGAATRPGSSSTAGDPPGSSPNTSARPPVLQPWAGVAGLLGGVALVGAWAARRISRRRS